MLVQVETTVNAMKRIASGEKMQQRDTLRMAVSIAFVQRALRAAQSDELVESLEDMANDLTSSLDVVQESPWRQTLVSTLDRALEVLCATQPSQEAMDREVDREKTEAARSRFEDEIEEASPPIPSLLLDALRNHAVPSYVRIDDVLYVPLDKVDVLEAVAKEAGLKLIGTSPMQLLSGQRPGDGAGAGSLGMFISIGYERAEDRGGDDRVCHLVSAVHNFDEAVRDDDFYIAMVSDECRAHVNFHRIQLPRKMSTDRDGALVFDFGSTRRYRLPKDSVVFKVGATTGLTFGRFIKCVRRLYLLGKDYYGHVVMELECRPGDSGSVVFTVVDGVLVPLSLVTVGWQVEGRPFCYGPSVSECLRKQLPGARIGACDHCVLACIGAHGISSTEATPPGPCPCSVTHWASLVDGYDGEEKTKHAAHSKDTRIRVCGHCNSKTEDPPVHMANPSLECSELVFADDRHDDVKVQ